MVRILTGVKGKWHSINWISKDCAIRLFILIDQAAHSIACFRSVYKYAHIKLKVPFINKYQGSKIPSHRPQYSVLNHRIRINLSAWWSIFTKVDEKWRIINWISKDCVLRSFILIDQAAHTIACFRSVCKYAYIILQVLLNRIIQ